MLIEIPLEAVVRMSERLITHPIPEDKEEDRLYLEVYGFDNDLSAWAQKTDEEEEDHEIHQSIPGNERFTRRWTGYSVDNLREIEWYVDTGTGAGEGNLSVSWLPGNFKLIIRYFGDDSKKNVRLLLAFAHAAAGQTTAIYIEPDDDVELYLNQLGPHRSDPAVDRFCRLLAASAKARTEFKID